MLKLNTVLTGACFVLMALLGYMGTQALAKLDATNTAQTQITIKFDGIKSQVDDHETRIRMTEHEVTVLQQSQREDRHNGTPKMSDNNH